MINSLVKLLLPKLALITVKLAMILGPWGFAIVSVLAAFILPSVYDFVDAIFRAIIEGKGGIEINLRYEPLSYGIID